MRERFGYPSVLSAMNDPDKLPIAGRNGSGLIVLISIAVIAMLATFAVLFTP